MSSAADAEADLLAAYPYLLPRSPEPEQQPEPDRPFDYEVADRSGEEPAQPGRDASPVADFDQALDDALSLTHTSRPRSPNVTRVTVGDHGVPSSDDMYASVPPPSGSAAELSWPQARSVAVHAGRRPLGVERCPLADALGASLAEPLAATTHVPAFDTSAMDGWAVAGPPPWRLRVPAAGEGLAGQPVAAALDDGAACRIATGAPVPPGTTAVLRREDGEVASPDRSAGVTTALRLRTGVTAPPLGRDIRPRGQECRAGEGLLVAGTLVTPAVLGLAAAIGHDELTVHRRPTVELLVLGDELLTEGPSRDGRIRDALGPMLPGWLASYGARFTGLRRVGDDRDALVAALRSCRADVVVTTGATAAGPRDFLHPALAEIGATLLVDGVLVRPGHPMLLAELTTAELPTAELPSAAGETRPRYLVGLPGNPFAAAVAAATLAEPLLRGLGGCPQAEPYRVPAAAALAGQPGHTRLVPVTLPERGAVPLRHDGPAMLRGLALAEGLAVVPPGGVAEGEPVEVLDVPCS
ncbi:molybdopterin molybdotransferase [Streptacidiphilus sp. BW17]|uniref:molybdopterin molybdotransferase MoeA n=1 Tax=Streptacidiphilus sp. BW17 TaxID=3156274 RepID=UPI003519D57B